MDKICMNCKFWDSVHRQTFSDGSCHKSYPIIPFVITTGVPSSYGIWPKTRGSDFCGDFERKEK